MKRFALVVLAAAALSACTTTKHLTLSPQASLDLHGRTLAATRHPVADFTAVTAGKAPFGLIGQLMMIQAGNDLVRKHRIEDPAVAVAEALAGKLAARHGMAVQSTGAVAADRKVPTLLATYGGADYLLDVETVKWTMLYYPVDWAHYRVLYGARLRLIEASTGKVVAEAGCDVEQGNDADPPSRDEMLADDAALLKAYIAYGAAACADKLARGAFQL